MRYVGPKNRLARREGVDLGLKTEGSKAQASLMRRIAIKPGQKPNSRGKKLTEFGQQLREKQKVQRTYGLTEKGLRKYFEMASAHVGNTSHYFVHLLEWRLDNVVYRLGFAPTRAAARQLVNHGHFQINGKKASIPSMQVTMGDVLTFKKDKTKSIPYVQEMLSKKNTSLPVWLERKADAGKVIGVPEVESIGNDVNLQAVIEFYSR